MTSPIEKYSKPWMSDFFHSFPHLNLSFISVNSSFNPTNHDYLESAIFWSGVPVSACVVLWIIFLGFFIHRCCQKHNLAKGGSSPCSGFWTGVFILLAFGLLGFGFYQNEEAHRGVQDCKRSVSNINSTIGSATQRMQTLEDMGTYISTNITYNLEEVLLPALQFNETIATQMEEGLAQIRLDAKTFIGDVDGIHISEENGQLNQALQLSSDVEYFRWMVNILVYCLYIFILLMAFIGLLMKSKSVLVVSAALLVVCSILMWATTGVYLSASIVLSDLCQDPDTYFISLADNNSLNEGAINAYIICDDTTQPYQNPIQDALNSVVKAGKALNDTLLLVKPFNISGLTAPVTDIRNVLKYATGNLSTLLTNVGSCVSIHQDYVEAVDAACVETLSATSFLTLMSLLVALVCSIIIFTLACSWRHFAVLKKRALATYLPVDDTDPFLPRPPQYDNDYGAMGHSNPRPWSERGTLQHSNSQGLHSDNTALITTHQNPPRTESPPPAYYPGRYIRQYAESSHSLGSVRSSTGSQHLSSTN